MALHISSSCFAVMCHSRVHRIRATAAASEGSSTLNTVTEEKVNLGKSDLKVTRLGIGAWSWGDTTYWNDLEWNGNFPFSTFSFYLGDIFLENITIVKSINIKCKGYLHCLVWKCC